MTKNLVIRPFVKSDYSAWREGMLGKLPPQNEFDPGPLKESNLTKAKFQKRLKFYRRAWDKDLLYGFGVFHRKSKKFVGLVNLMTYARLDLQSANLGYEIHNNFWGKGYAKEAAKACMDMAFKDLHFNRVEAGMEFKNRGSIGVAKSIRMKKEGIRRSFYFDKDKGWLDLIFYSLSAGEYGLKMTTPRIKYSLTDYL